MHQNPDGSITAYGAEDGAIGAEGWGHFEASEGTSDPLIAALDGDGGHDEDIAGFEGGDDWVVVVDEVEAVFDRDDVGGDGGEVAGEAGGAGLPASGEFAAAGGNVPDQGVCAGLTWRDDPGVGEIRFAQEGRGEGT